MLRVFTGAGGIHGNALGVVLDGRSVADQDAAGPGRGAGLQRDGVRGRRAPRGSVRIHTPAVELPFAGHPLVGTAWLLRHEGRPIDALRPPAGEVTRVVRGRPGVRGQPARVVAGLRARGLRLGGRGRGARGPARRGRSGDGIRARGRRRGARAGLPALAGDRRGRGHGVGRGAIGRAARPPGHDPPGHWARRSRCGRWTTAGSRSAAARCSTRCVRSLTDREPGSG